MASLGTEEDDGDLANHLNPDRQGDSSFLSSGGHEYYHLHPDQGAGGFVSVSDDEVSVGVDGFTLHAAGAEDDDTMTTAYSEYYHDEMGFDYNSGGEGYQTPPAVPMTPPGGTYSVYYHVDMGTEFAGEEIDPFFPVEEEAPAATAVALEAAEAPADDCCPVCLVQEDDDDGEGGATWSRVTACGHRFHEACVEKWLRVKPTCPVCRCSVAAAATGAEHLNDVEEHMTSGYSSYDLSGEAGSTRSWGFRVSTRFSIGDLRVRQSDGGGRCKGSEAGGGGTDGLGGVEDSQWTRDEYNNGGWLLVGGGTVGWLLPKTGYLIPSGRALRA
ncbi:hypothetical protein HU200_015199 [Digitaria exilis]|uniref:RING-type E3 ubiquitin transferase n=1 Tax=Digitaria exilis TaxID=1010633 RepID=A0A835KI84_9POAL|nr:hypothetical protein HU200_015199 [Digitaria exilis]